MEQAQLDTDLDPMFVALWAGDPAPVAAAFGASGADHGTILGRLLEAELDVPVAAAFALIWQDIAPDMSDDSLNLLRWYLTTEDVTRHPARKSTHLAVLTRLIGQPALPRTDAARDLGFSAVRVAVECGGPLDLHRAACRLLHRLAAVWINPPGSVVDAPMLYAAIQTVDLTVLKSLIDRLPDAPLTPDLQHALDWANGLMIEFAGIDPWLEGVIDRQFQRDPQSPIAAQRKAQLGQHQGQGFATLAPLFHTLRTDPRDPTLRPALQFAYWRANNDNLLDEIAFLSGQLRALDPNWTDDTGPGLSGDPIPLQRPPGGCNLARLADHALALAAVDIDLAGPFTPPALEAEFARLVQSIATAPLPPSWALPDVLQAAQRLIQIDLREASWIVHFVDAPHAQGLPQYGTVDLRRFPVLHRGLMASAAALCRAGLTWLMAGNTASGHGPIARLAQLHTHTSLEIDQPDAALALLDRIGGLGILTDVVAILRDNCRLQRGDVAAAQSAPPPSRAGSEAYPFLDQADWTAAECIPWVPLADDPAIAARFEVVWPDGHLQSFDHATPPGRLATAQVPGLSLIGEDLLLGPAGHVLRPNTYHTSAEYPWDSALVVAAQKRALRLRPTSTATCDQPVLVLEAFEALRGRSYYHWMIPILSRVALALEGGLLDDRLLVVPAGLSGWMQETLALIGLPPERRIVVPPDQKLHLRDALLLSSIEHVSAAAVQALRRRLLGADPAAPSEGSHLFLSRKDQNLRKLHNESAIEDMAKAMGFQIISPQDHSVAEQVRLLSQARGVAAVEGAALTNTMFSPPGTRVLAISCINDMMPIFNDLAIVLGHHHRKLAGRGLTGIASYSRFQPPFSVDLDLARRSLSWVLEG